MKAERDELTLRVFPALRKVCEERGIAWGEVDLRWGIPEEKKGEVLSTCLKFIDDCRPYFIGMLGERYGWVDETTPDGVLKDYPWLRDHKGKSITELEILHGVLNNPKMAGHAYFYFRDPGYVNTIQPEQRSEFLEGPRAEDIIKYGAIGAEQQVQKRRGQLAALKDIIRRSNLPVHDGYRDPIQFGEFVREDLMKVINSLAPPPSPLSDAERSSTALDREDIAHEAFAASRFGIYIPRKEYFNRLDAHASDNGKPLVILGESGSGKSALLAHWAFRYRAQHPDQLVLVHFVGASSKSTDWASMLRRFMGEFKRHFAMTEEIPAQDDALRAAFPIWLSMAGAHSRVILIIDSLNQLEDRNGAPDLIWLPPTIPANIRLVLSTLPGRPLDAIRNRKWPEMMVEGLTPKEKDMLIICYLRKYRRELETSNRQELIKAKETKNPLYLRALVEELRIHGEFGKLPDQIKNYLNAKTVDALYEMILARYERDYERNSPGLVKDSVTLLWAARRGLSKAELLDLLGANGKPLPDAYWAPLYLAMEHSLVEKDGQISFFHDFFRVAVENKYLSTQELKRSAHLRIADYFAALPGGVRKTEEFPWQLTEAAEWDRLEVLLIDPLFFLIIWQAQEYDIKRYLSRIERYAHRCITDIYKQVIDNPERYKPLFLYYLSILLSQTGHPDDSTKINTYLINFFRDRKDQDRLELVLGLQANVLIDSGMLENAFKLLKEQEQICRNLKNTYSLQINLGNQGNILAKFGDPIGAMAHYSEKENICRERNIQNGLQMVLGNKAGLLFQLAEQNNDKNKKNSMLNEAILLLDEQEHICKELGEINSLQRLFGNKAVIYISQNRHDEAWELLKNQEKTCEDIGNMQNLAVCIGNQAGILRAKGKLDEAMYLFKRQEQICRDLKNIEGIATSLANQSLIYGQQNKFKEAEDKIREADILARKHGFWNLSFVKEIDAMRKSTIAKQSPMKGILKARIIRIREGELLHGQKTMLITIDKGSKDGIVSGMVAYMKIHKAALMEYRTKAIADDHADLIGWYYPSVKPGNDVIFNLGNRSDNEIWEYFEREN